MGNSTRGFVHLHVHSEFSSVDSLARVAAIVDQAKFDGQSAVAISDHGSLGAMWRFRGYAAKAGIKPIPALEAYVSTSGDRFNPKPILVKSDSYDADDSSEAESKKNAYKKKYYEHLTLVAFTEQGWTNLNSIHTESQDTRWSKYPLIDYDLIHKYNEGIIILTGCIGGAVAGSLSRGDEERARERLRNAIEAVGGDTSRVYVEVMDHAIPEQYAVTDSLRALAKEFNLKMVATNDAHYINESDAEAHDAWLCVATKTEISATKRFRFHGHGHHMRNETEMRELFNGAQWWQEACDNTVEIADRVVDNIFGKTHLRLPVFDVRRLAPDFAATREGDSDAALSAAYLRKLVGVGAKNRYGTDESGRMSAEVRERLAFEFDVVSRLGVVDYFLIVWDLVDWARSDRGYPTPQFPRGEPGKKKPIRVGPGRGSAAGSSISYSLMIVGVDPLKNGLLFERFLDPERVGMPDIDIDFEKRRRMEVVRYLALQWGYDRVAHIGTYQTAKTRAALKDAGRVLELVTEANQLSELVPLEGGVTPVPFASLVADTPANDAFHRKLEALGKEGQKVFDIAKSFENVTKEPSVHPCGILICDEPMLGLVPLRKNTGKDAGPNALKVTEWEGKDVDDYGLLKVDVLGLRNLDVVSMTCHFIQERTGEVIDTDALDPDDGSERSLAAFALLRAGRTAGIFQMESAGMARLAEDSGPTSLDDLSAIMALYRPGPMGQNMHTRWAMRMRGAESVSYDLYTSNPQEQAVISSVLDESKGIFTFQEQAMRLGEVLAGFGAPEKNRLRKAVSKKIQSEVDAVGELWFKGAVKESVLSDGTTKIAFARSTAESVWDAIKSSARYAFNKSHSTAYGQLAYVTAYLKANFPVEFAAAILAITDDADKRLAAVHSLSEDGITLLSPHLNRSMESTSPDGDAVRIGLSEIKGVGKNASYIIEERNANGPFASLHDLMKRVSIPKGAVDEETGEASQSVTALPMTAVEGLIEAGALDFLGPRYGLIRSLRAHGQWADRDVPDIEWGPLSRSIRERERLGVIISEHPLIAFEDTLRELKNPYTGAYYAPVSHAHTAPPRSRVNIVGVLSAFNERSYRGGRFASITIEGVNSSIGGAMWNDNLEALDSIPHVGSIVSASARVRVRSIEVEDESGEVTIQERRELTFMEVNVVDVDDPIHEGASPFEGRSVKVSPHLIARDPVRFINLGNGMLEDAMSSSVVDEETATLLRDAAMYGFCPEQSGLYAVAVGGKPFLLSVGDNWDYPDELVDSAEQTARTISATNSKFGTVLLD